MFHRLGILFFLVTLLSGAAHCQDDLLKFLIEQNEAAREKIKTAEYKVQWTTDAEREEGLRHNEGLGEVKTKGNLRFSTYKLIASISATGWRQEQSASVVINDKYLAYWPVIGNFYIYQDDHRSLDILSDDAKRSRDFHTTPDIYSVNFAFGGERRTTFREMMKLHPDSISWTAEESKQSNGETVYLIKRYSPFMNDPSKPNGVWTIDPQKGFLVTQAVFYSKAGNIWVTRTTDPKEVGSGIWFPASYQEHCYGGSSDLKARKEPSQSMTIQLTDISTNSDIPDDYFVIDSILPQEYRNSTTLIRKGLDGNTEAYVYEDGGYVLRDTHHEFEDSVDETLINLHGNTALESPQENQSQTMEKQPGFSKAKEVSSHVKDSSSRQICILFGLSVIVVLLIFIFLKFGRQATTKRQ